MLSDSSSKSSVDSSSGKVRGDQVNTNESL
jgi:hypothetical protein